jgi:RNA polymerase sigma factor (sigma-70 family)
MGAIDYKRWGPMSDKRLNGRVTDLPTGGKWGALLKCLSDDPETAARMYIHFHQALTAFFIHRGSTTPDEHADETLERVSELIGSGKTITSYKFFYSVARFIWKESCRRRRSIEKAVDHISYSAERTSDPEQILLRQMEAREDDNRLSRLRECLNQLSDEERRLIILYYKGDNQSRIDNRRLLAKEYGVSPAVLRVKVSRLRERLEKGLRHHGNELNGTSRGSMPGRRNRMTGK